MSKEISHNLTVTTDRQNLTFRDSDPLLCVFIDPSDTKPILNVAVSHTALLLYFASCPSLP